MQRRPKKDCPTESEDGAGEVYLPSNPIDYSNYNVPPLFFTLHSTCPLTSNSKQQFGVNVLGLRVLASRGRLPPMARLPPGVTGNSGLVLNDGQVAFIRALRAAVPDVPLHVTSATRTPERQAAALVVKRKRGEDLRRLYRANSDIAAALMAAPNTTAAMGAIIRRYMEQGRYLSRHMRGDAVDFRSRNLNQGQIQRVMDAAVRLGAKPLLESDHLHIERVGGTISDLTLAARDAAGRAGGYARRGSAALMQRRRTVALVTTTSVVVGLLVLAALVSRRRSS